MEKDPLCISKHNIFVRVHNFELMFITWFHEFLIPNLEFFRIGENNNYLLLFLRHHNLWTNQKFAYSEFVKLVCCEQFW